MSSSLTASIFRPLHVYGCDLSVVAGFLLLSLSSSLPVVPCAFERLGALFFSHYPPSRLVSRLLRLLVAVDLMRLGGTSTVA